MQLSEQSISTLESNIPKLARDALEKAYFEALTVSGKVLRAVNGQLIETYAEGTEQVLRTIQSPVRVTQGTKLKRKPAQP